MLASEQESGWTVPSNPPVAVEIGRREATMWEIAGAASWSRTRPGLPVSLIMACARYPRRCARRYYEYDGSMRNRIIEWPIFLIFALMPIKCSRYSRLVRVSCCISVAIVLSFSSAQAPARGADFSRVGEESRYSGATSCDHIILSIDEKARRHEGVDCGHFWAVNPEVIPTNATPYMGHDWHNANEWLVFTARMDSPVNEKPKSFLESHIERFLERALSIEQTVCTGAAVAALILHDEIVSLSWNINIPALGFLSFFWAAITCHYIWSQFDQTDGESASTIVE